MPNVQLKGVSKYFGRVKALEEINLEIRDGEYLALLGPSGCGKTTLINCITGIVEPTKGTIFIDGKKVNDLPIERRDFAMVFQSIAIFPHMTVEQNAAYGPFVKDVPKETQVEVSKDMLELVDLLEQKHLRPRSLSGGAKQKTAAQRRWLHNQERKKRPGPYTNGKIWRTRRPCRCSYLPRSRRLRIRLRNNTARRRRLSVPQHIKERSNIMAKYKVLIADSRYPAYDEERAVLDRSVEGEGGPCTEFTVDVDPALILRA